MTINLNLLRKRGSAFVEFGNVQNADMRRARNSTAPHVFTGYEDAMGSFASFSLVQF
jgi:hypothetical protein